MLADKMLNKLRQSEGGGGALRGSGLDVSSDFQVRCSSEPPSLQLTYNLLFLLSFSCPKTMQSSKAVLFTCNIKDNAQQGVQNN